MFEQITERKKDPLRLLFFLLGCLVVAGLIGFAIVAPGLWPAGIPKKLLAKIAPSLPPIAMGNPAPPHVKLENVPKGTGPRVVPRKPFASPPPFMEPRQVPKSPPMLGDDQESAPPRQGDSRGNALPYCENCVLGPPCPGCIGTDPSFAVPIPRPRAEAKVEEPRVPPPVTRVTIGGKVQEAKLIRQLKPTYPPLAIQVRISGVVHLTAVISKSGTIQELRVIGGPPMLIPSAIEAVRQWVYRPTLLNDEPVEVVTQIDVNFTLAR